jgi:membrane protein implicated in regulation of membrane protease activity
MIWNNNMLRYINKLMPGVLMAVGVFVMAISSLTGGGISAYIGLPLFLVGYLWLLLPVLQQRKLKS